ncbi:MAG: deoxyribonuclease V [Deltaproteobacteria bacterium]|jgi:deoxyribonuclease V|nr:deoxyribonuclease V [Deltaproteobacteria bacterium]
MLKEKRAVYHHSWNLPPEKAIELQKQLACKVVRTSCIRIGHIHTVAGIDSSYRSKMACAAVVVLSLKHLELIEFTTAILPVEFPYIPGLLSFREGPAIIKALQKLKTRPDILLFDGQGIAHQRRFGIASHIGLLLDCPTIGCAKTKLVGQYEEPDSHRGSFTYLRIADKPIGAVVRTRTGVKPVFVSTGHRVNLRQSIKLVLDCHTGFRLPEPIRQADRLSRQRLQQSL